jgi:hypothetical protein
MKTLLKRYALLMASAAILPASATSTFAADPGGGLKAGAARVDITPAVADLLPPFKTVHDPLFVRALVLDNGSTRAVIVVGDVPTIGAEVMADMVQRIAAAAHAPVSNVVLATTHDHNTLRIDTNPVGIILPASPKVTKMTVDATLQAVKQAAAELQPAKAGYGTGSFDLAAAPGDPGERANSTAPIDRTLGVFEVERTDGQPIALIVNGGPEPTMTSSLKEQVGGDLSGAVERYLEHRYADKAVVMYTVGSPPNLSINGRRPVAGASPADPNVLADAVGAVMGEEVLSTASRIQATADLQISGALDVLQCPGKVTTPLNNPGQCSDAPGSKLPACVFHDKDTGPVALQLAALRLGGLTMVTADADITAPVWARFKAQAPANTVLVALVYGPMHYVVEDSVYPTNSYQVTASGAKAGCAANGFISKTSALIAKTH